MSSFSKDARYNKQLNQSKITFAHAGQNLNNNLSDLSAKNLNNYGSDGIERSILVPFSISLKKLFQISLLPMPVRFKSKSLSFFF